MKHGNCLVALWWFAGSGFKGDLVITRSKSKRALHFQWVPYGLPDETLIKHRQPLYRQWGWKAYFHWWWEHKDYIETRGECRARVSKEKLKALGNLID